ncbi:glycosyltransferase family 1 protein [Roseomonas sp. E05]|uniref:glycosyltransferase family 4 protein n=1 Tax=Roseomonas sp. E05 TaxID=3046310 RepID=UPI0024BB1483|nr:glycosyltransferase family 1 protein [Roseomonas sp. E05]MDJ0389628.1 glycosyltransferase family 1 protein [Roseomonas sp. E05]
MTHDLSGTLERDGIATDPDALLAQADQKREGRDWAGAAELYAAVVRLRPDAWPLMVQEGHCRKEAGQPAEALARYLAAEALAPEDADLQLQIGHAHKLLNEWHKAALAYARAVALDPGNADAWREASATSEWLTLHAPRPGGDALDEEVEEEPEPEDAALLALMPPPSLPETEPELAGSTEAKLQLVLDVTDLLDYFNGARTPTGIQRVQMGIVSRAIAEPAHPAMELCFAAYDAADLAWHAVDEAGFTALVALSVTGSDPEEPSWVQARDTLRRKVAKAPAFDFMPGAVLVNLGNSWGFPDYFRALRTIQQSHGVRYIPFMHDCVPLIVPEHCLLTLVQDYARWFGALGLHAHGLLCNSENTLRDVRQQLGRLFPALNLPGHVIRLDADPRSVAAPTGNATLSALRVLRPSESFALFVATIESRKDHLLVFNAWLQLLRRHGPAKVPRLVCVGKEGWHSEAALSLLRNAPELQRHVVLLSRISDLELSALYERCAFTVYNSYYEGWGLPITEAMAHGKVVVTARHSALVEAGGEAAVYFTPQSLPDLQEKLERVILDAEFRAAQEAVVREKGKPRSWSAVKDEIFSAVAALAREPARPLEQRATLQLGQRYLARRMLRTQPELGGALADAVRDGPQWYAAEDWGVWSRGGTATMRLPLPEGAVDAPLRLYLQLRSPPVRCTMTVRCTAADGTFSHFELTLETGRDGTFMLDLPPARAAGILEMDLDNGAGVDLAAMGLPDPRCIGAGLLSFMICRLDDYAARLAFLEQQSFDTPAVQ